MHELSYPRVVFFTSCIFLRVAFFTNCRYFLRFDCLFYELSRYHIIRHIVNLIQANEQIFMIRNMFLQQNLA